MASRTPVSTAVFDALRARILGGELAPGDPIASERDLAERFAVNRHAVREAVKRLQQADLVTVSHGGATRVSDWRARGGLDLLAGLALHRGGDGLLRSALEMRHTIGVDAARHCALRAGDATLDAIVALHARIAGDDPAALEPPYRALWALLVDGSDNLAYRLALNSLIGAIDADLPLALSVLAAELRDHGGRAALVTAVAARDADGAARAADALLTTSVPEATAWSS